MINWPEMKSTGPKRNFWLLYVDGRIAAITHDQAAAEAANHHHKEQGSTLTRRTELTREEVMALALQAHGINFSHYWPEEQKCSECEKTALCELVVDYMPGPHPGCAEYAPDAQFERPVCLECIEQQLMKQGFEADGFGGGGAYE